MRSLSYQQRLFVEYYLGESSGSAVDAARRAGYQWPEKLGPRLVEQSRVRAAINARLATAAMTANEVLARVADIASCDLLDFIDVDKEGGCKVDLKLVKRLGLGHLIKRLRINKDGIQDIELEARLPALIKLGEYYNLWNREAPPEVSLVELAKGLRERYEHLRSKKRDDGPAGALPGPTGPVQ
jgi:Terminase small subunit